MATRLGILCQVRRYSHIARVPVNGPKHRSKCPVRGDVPRASAKLAKLGGRPRGWAALRCGPGHRWLFADICSRTPVDNGRSPPRLDHQKLSPDFAICPLSKTFPHPTRRLDVTE